ncbi:hypothetical protein HNQ50_000219 [Silvimonas terrae]|uniref:Autotransporter domain-containing protein n=1 Tax=Silvimonas terrae TaxID=300266 RepID=A0A840R845_9NEIS|nr:autotransporter outer membrane beta-barrel domain-containing protein [Silvimonas terrae]MBB5189509.1 hypothetical protein [Silvimonas terrae]
MTGLLSPLGHAQITLPSSTGVTVTLNSAYPGEASFTLPAGSQISNAGTAVTGDNTQDWQFTNYGTVQNSATVAASALKLGSLDVVTTGIASRVDNYGTIVSNASTSGGPSGVQFTHGGIVYNYAGALISGPDGVHTDTASVAVYNDGEIHSTVSSAIYTGRGALIENHATGVISGYRGIVSNGAYPVDIKNEGTISTSNNALWFFGGGVYSLLNTASGVIRGGNPTNATALFTSGAQSQIINYGLIQNPSSGSAIDSSADQNIFINAGRVLAGGTAMVLSGDGNTVYNLGLLSGSTAIQLTGNNNTIVLGSHVALPTLGVDVYGPGSNLVGDLTSTGADSSVRLTDSGSEDVAITGFEHLIMAGTDWTLSGRIVMSDTAPDALHIQSGTLLLTGTWQGSGTQIDPGGTLLVGNATTPGATLNSPLGIRNAGTLGGYGQLMGDITNQGQIKVADAAATLGTQGNGTLTVIGALTNDGTIDLRGQTPGNQLRLAGNLNGHGNVLLNTALGNDRSLTDQLVMDASHGAATASGQTALQITNRGGAGDVTERGILVVALQNGASTAPDSFVLAGRAVAGLYEYALVRDPQDQQWYLQSTYTPPPTPPAPPTPIPRYRPEIGAYIGNAYAATTLFNHDLQDRQAGCNNTVVDASLEPCAGWVRLAGSVLDGSAVQNQVNLRSHLWLIQAGTDIARWPANADGQFHLGIMAGFGQVNTWSQADHNPNHAAGSVDSYTAGLYGTWFADDSQRLGAYR